MNNERVQSDPWTQDEYDATRKLFAERKNLTEARLEGHRRGERIGQRNGVVMGFVIGVCAALTVLMLTGKVAL